MTPAGADASIPKTPSKWLLPIMIVGSLAILGGLLFAAVFGVFSLLKSSAPYQHAVSAAIANPQVQSALGNPITDGWLMSGNICTTNDSGTASLAIPISGPKGEATIRVLA